MKRNKGKGRQLKADEGRWVEMKEAKADESRWRK